MAVLAQVVGFEQCLARLDGMLHGVEGILFGSLMFAQRRSGVLVRRLREIEAGAVAGGQSR